MTAGSGQSSGVSRQRVRVDGRQLVVSNLDKVLFPEVSFTKAQVIDYYVRIAPVLLPHLSGRPVTFTRWPDGVEGQAFFEKNSARHAPDWVRRVTVPSPGSSRNREVLEMVLLETVADLAWSANLAALELHVPQWQIGSKLQPALPDLLVLDLDPGPQAGIYECCRVAERLRDRLVLDGLDPVVKTSGSKGMQVYVPLNTPGVTYDDTKGFSHALAQLLEKQHPKEVVSVMRKDLRGGKVFIDWSQNDEHKTTVCVYSLRARPEPTASTPLTWDEVDAAHEAGDADSLKFDAPAVLERATKHGDRFAPVVELEQRLPSLS